jgi:hypothetical protein
MVVFLVDLMIEKYMTSKNTNRCICSSSFHISGAIVPYRLEMFDEAELIRKIIVHNNRFTNSVIKHGECVRLLNKRGVFEKEGQRFTLKIYIVKEVGLNSVHVERKYQKFNIKVSPLSRDIDNSLRQKQLEINPR